MDNAEQIAQDYSFANNYNDESMLPEGVMVLHKDFVAKDMFEITSPTRRRFRGKFGTNDPKSFFDYVKSREQEDGAEFNRTFVNADNPVDQLFAQAVLNFGTTDAAGHCDDTAVLNLQKDPLMVQLLDVTSQYQTITDFAETLENFLGLDVLTGFKEDGVNEISLAKAVSALRNAKIDRLQQATMNTTGLKYEASDMEKIEIEGVDENLAEVFIFETPLYQNLTVQSVKLRVDFKVQETDKGLRAYFRLKPIGMLGHYMAAAKDFQDRIAAELDNVAIGSFR